MAAHVSLSPHTTIHCPMAAITTWPRVIRRRQLQPAVCSASSPDGNATSVRHPPVTGQPCVFGCGQLLRGLQLQYGCICPSMCMGLYDCYGLHPPNRHTCLSLVRPLGNLVVPRVPRGLHGHGLPPLSPLLSPLLSPFPPSLCAGLALAATASASLSTTHPAIHHTANIRPRMTYTRKQVITCVSLLVRRTARPGQTGPTCSPLAHHTKTDPTTTLVSPCRNSPRGVTPPNIRPLLC